MTRFISAYCGDIWDFQPLFLKKQDVNEVKIRNTVLIKTRDGTQSDGVKSITPSWRGVSCARTPFLKLE